MIAHARARKTVESLSSLEPHLEEQRGIAKTQPGRETPGVSPESPKPDYGQNHQTAAERFSSTSKLTCPVLPGY